MISVNQARQFIRDHSPTPVITESATGTALGKVLAAPVYAPFDLPHFRQSAMDGYAIRHGRENYVVKGESKAGDNCTLKLAEGEAYRIFTGAMVPENADTVVIQEHTTVSGQNLMLHKIPRAGANIRAIGEQIRKGSPVLQKGTKLNSAGIGMLAGFGIEKVEVFAVPRIGIIATGSELLSPSDKPEPGKIYDSNTLMLKTALIENGCPGVNIYRAKDEKTHTEHIIKQALQENDILLISGGISVGEYDFVQGALRANRVKEIFYKVNHKPGKPLWFGKKDRKTVFALPGNPASVLTCFYIYVLPELRRQRGITEPENKWYQARTKSKILNPKEKTMFLRAYIENGIAEIPDGQSSAMLHGFTTANAIAMIPENTSVLHENQSIEYMLMEYN